MARGQTQAADSQLNLSNQYASQGNDRANALMNQLLPMLDNQYQNPTGLSTPNATIAQQGLKSFVGLPNTNGYTPDQKNAMNTASNQILGGAVGGAVGQGNLTAARTRNAAGFGTALDEAAREAGRQQSENALSTEKSSADLSAQQQQADAQLKAQQNVASGQMLSAQDIANGQLQAQQNESNAQLKAAQQAGALSGLEDLYGQNMQELMSSLGLGPSTLNARAAGKSGFDEFMGGLGTLGGIATNAAALT